MKNIFKIVICSIFTLCLFTFVKTDVKAATFDNNFAVANDNTCYSYAVDWHNGHGKTLHELFPGGTKIPYVKVKIVNPSGNDNVYAFFVAYKPFVDKDYYYMSIFYVSKSAFEIESVYREPIQGSDIKGGSPKSYGGYYYLWVPISSYCDTRDNGVDNLGGVVSFTKDMPIETYDIIINGYRSEIKDNYFLKKIIAFMGGDEDSDVSESDGRGEASDGSDERDNSSFDENIGALKFKSSKMLYLHNGENHSLNIESAIWRFTFGKKTSTQFSVKGDGHYIQYGFRISGYQSLYRGGAKENLKNYVSGYYYCDDLDNSVVDIPYATLSRELQNYFNNSPNRKSYMGQYYNTQIYFRLCYRTDDGTFKHGTWIRYNDGDASQERTDDDTVDEGNTDDGGIPEDGEYDDDHGSDPANTDAGAGDDYDEADDAAEENHNRNNDDGGNSNVSLDSIKDLVNKIGDVPLLIAKIFSFLPGWCLTLIATAFTMFIFLLIIKLIRG